MFSLHLFYKFPRNTLISIRFPIAPTQNMCFPLGSYATCVFLTFSISSNAKPLFSLRFLQVPTQHLCFPCVFYRFPRNNCFLFCVFYRFPRRTCVVLVFSICSHANLSFLYVFYIFIAKQVFSFRAPWVPTQNLCFPCVFNMFPRNTCVFLAFSIGSHGKPLFFLCFP